MRGNVYIVLYLRPLMDEWDKLQPSSLDERLRAEGFVLLAMYDNSELGESQTIKNLSNQSADLYEQFRIIPAYLAFTDAPAEYEGRHLLYILRRSAH